MPSKSPAQARLMRAVAHGWEKPGGEGPSPAVAREFVNADRGMYTGGLAAMNLHEGGGVYTPWGDVPDVPDNVSSLLGRDFSGMRGIYGNLFRRMQDQARDRYAPPPRPSDDTPVGVAPPPRIAPPPSRPPPRDRRAGRDTKYSQQLRDHKKRIANILKGNAEGGLVYYQEGGDVRAGHAEGKNPYPVSSARYKLWERKHHRDPAPPPVAQAPEAEDIGWLDRLLGRGEEYTGRSERELEEMGEAHGGYVGYRYGGLAQAAGRVPPTRGGMRPGMMKPRMHPGMDPRRSGPKMQPPSMDGGAGIPGGPMVPPNMRGHLQKMRMQNRPTPNVGHGVNRVGDGGNRVGQQDQQGGLARALQRGTGRPPMSRRSGFPGR